MTLRGDGLNYLESGAGDPSTDSGVVLLDWTPWQTTALADALASRFRVLAVDPPAALDAGRGQSSPVEDVASSVADLALSTGLETYALVGTSLGADVAFRIALIRPASVAVLTLVSPTSVAPVNSRFPDTPESAVRAMLAHGETWATENSSHPQPPSERTEALAALSALWGQTGRENADLLSQISAATLVVFGQEDRLVSREAGSLWKEKVTNCNLCYVYGAGHAVGVDRPGALASVVLDFVARRETFIVENRSSLISP